MVTVEYIRKGKKETVEIELEGAHEGGFELWGPKKSRIRIHRFHHDDEDDDVIIVPDIRRHLEIIKGKDLESI